MFTAVTVTIVSIKTTSIIKMARFGRIGLPVIPEESETTTTLYNTNADRE